MTIGGIALVSTCYSGYLASLYFYISIFAADYARTISIINMNEWMNENVYLAEIKNIKLHTNNNINNIKQYIYV